MLEQMFALSCTCELVDVTNNVPAKYCIAFDLFLTTLSEISFTFISTKGACDELS